MIDINEITDPRARVSQVQSLTDGWGADVVVEVVGHPDVCNEGIRMLARGGRYLELGNINPRMTYKADPSLLVGFNRSIIGVSLYPPEWFTEGNLGGAEEELKRLGAFENEGLFPKAWGEVANIAQFLKAQKLPATGRTNKPEVFARLLALWLRQSCDRSCARIGERLVDFIRGERRSPSRVRPRSRSCAACCTAWSG